MPIQLAVRTAVWQTAVAAFALAATAGATWAMVAAGTLIGITAIRVRGRFVDRWLLIFMGYRGRARVRRAATALDVLAPSLSTREYRDPTGSLAGVVTDGWHWTVVLRLDSVDPSPPADFPRLIGVLQSAVDPAGEVRAPAVQLVRWAVPMPVDPDKPAGKAAPAPAWNVHWIAVRGTKATPTAAMRLATILTAQGFAVRPLREDELSTELTSSLGAARAGGAVTARESWWSLSLGRLHHATYRLTRPPRDPARLAGALGWLAGPPSLSTCAALILSAPAARAAANRNGSHTQAGITVALRIAVAAGGSRREVRSALRRALGPMRSHARAMNGEHADGILATIPLGGR